MQEQADFLDASFYLPNADPPDLLLQLHPLPPLALRQDIVQHLCNTGYLDNIARSPSLRRS